MSKNKILIVEGEKDGRRELKNTLENLGYKITGIVSTLEMMHSNLRLHFPDLVLLDKDMEGNPDKTELAFEIKEQYHLPVIYLIANSGNHTPENRYLSRPFSSIAIPFNDQELHMTIETAVSKSRMENQIEQLTSSLNTVRGITKLISKTSDTAELLQGTCDVLISDKAYSSAWFLYLDNNGTSRGTASAGLNDKFETILLQYPNGINPVCLSHLQNNEEIFSFDNSIECKDCPIRNFYPDKGTIISKVRFRNQLLGFLAVSLPISRINNKEELDWLVEISGSLGLALSSIETVQKMAEAESTQLDSETRFRHAFDFAAVGMCIVGTDGKLQKANAAFSELLGYTQAELYQMHFDEISHPDDIKKSYDALEKLTTGKIENTTFEKRYISKNNNTIWANVSVSCIRDEFKRPKFFITHILDITNRVLAESELIENEKLYATFMNSTSDLAYLKDERLKYIMTNKKQQEFFNKSEQEICGKTDFDLMPEEHAVNCQKSDLKVLESMQMAISTEAVGDKIYETCKFPVKIKEGKTGVGAFIRDITEQINAGQELQKLSQVVKQSTAAIIVTNMEGKIEYVNPATCAISGYSSDELIGKHPSIFNSGDMKSEDFLEMWNAIKNGNEWRGEFRNRKKNGELYTERASVSPIKNQKNEITHYLSIQEDVTERKQAELIQKVLFNISKQAFETNDINQLLEIVRNELSTLIDTSNFYVAFYNEETGMLTSAYVDDERDTITSWPAEKSLTGYVVRHNKSLLLKHNDFLKLIETGEVELVGADSEVWLGVPLTVDGKPYGAFVVQDYQNPNAYSENEMKMLEFIASQVSLSIQRQKAIIELQQTLVKAEASDRLKTAFINNISHEIRTPLNGILGFSDMMFKQDSTPEDKELFHTVIQKSSKRLLNTVNSYMDIAMLVSGTMEVRRHPSNLEKLCDEIYNDFIEICSFKGLELKLRKTDLTTPLILNTDFDKLRKILTHLLDNAIKFTPKGSISFGYGLNDKEVLFFMSDTGAGIKPDALNIIFDAFMQADVSATRGYEGSGLGLSIVSGMIKLLGGNFWVESEIDRGSTFYFTLPVSENQILAPGKSVEKTKGKSTSNPLIVVAEDDDSNYKYIEIVLRNASYQVIRAENGFQAVDYCRNHKQEVSLVLMDIKMPSMDGFEATRQIRSFLPGLPIIALSAHVTTEDENAAIAAGCSDYVTKPVSKTRLLEIIENFTLR
jgi:PAS domain S-box-containing protein